MVVLSSSVVVSNKLRQSTSALCSSLLRFGIVLRRPLQFEDETLTSPMVWLRREHIICGTVLVARSGKVESVETHRSG